MKQRCSRGTELLKRTQTPKQSVELILTWYAVGSTVHLGLMTHIYAVVTHGSAVEGGSGHRVHPESVTPCLSRARTNKDNEVGSVS